MKALLMIFSLLLLLLIAGLWVGPGSYPDRWRLEEKILVQGQENSAKKSSIKKIQDELNDVTSSKEALEERARSELGMTKKGETFFEVIMQPKPEGRQQNSSDKLETEDAKTSSEPVDSDKDTPRN